MAIIPFNPTNHPDFGMARQYKPRVLKASFGDGYSQRAADGTNANPATLPAVWTNMPKSERDALLAFFEERGGWQAFSYQYVDEAAPKVYICEEWSDTHEDGDTYSVTATFMQVYDIV